MFPNVLRVIYGQLLLRTMREHPEIIIRNQGGYLGGASHPPSRLRRDDFKFAKLC